MERAAPLLKPSTVAAERKQAGPNTQRDPRRTSSSAWLHGHNDPRRTLPAARLLQRRVASLLRLPAEVLARNVEPVLVVHYAERQFYEPHLDAFASARGGAAACTQEAPEHSDPRYQPAAGGSNRHATVLVFLTDGAPGGGGHTIFPLATPSANVSAADFGSAHDAAAAGAPTCEFAGQPVATGLMVQPARGDALVWYNQHPNGSLDARVRHGACPVLSGEKAAANVWVWNRGVIYASGN